MEDLTAMLSYDEVYEPASKPDPSAFVALSVDRSPPKAADSRTDAGEWRAADLLAHHFPPPKWAVPGLLAEGLSLLAGAPKVGKSWLALGIALAVSNGDGFFGGAGTEAASVLYLALEDTPRRLQSRLRRVAVDRAAGDLTFWTTCPRLPDAEALLRSWIESSSNPRLIVVDVFARLRAAPNPKASAYDADYESTRVLKQVADEYGLCVLLVHHTRKSEAADWLDLVSGTQGLAGSVDATLVLTRQRGGADGQLHLTGRDVAETSYPLSFDADSGSWRRLDGCADDYKLGATRRRVLQLLRQSGPMRPEAIAEALPDLASATVRQSCRRMAADEQLDTDGEGNYFLPAAIEEEAELV